MSLALFDNSQILHDTSRGSLADVIVRLEARAVLAPASLAVRWPAQLIPVLLLLPPPLP
jgi:hypothetical protein